MLGWQILLCTFCNVLCLHVAVVSARDVPAASNDIIPNEYTAFDDASWAIVSTSVSTMLGPDKQNLYDSYIADCNRQINPRTNNNCQTEDAYRLYMNRQQPSGCHNYTKQGYAKIKAPPELFSLISDFYQANKGNDVQEWHSINTYHNMWEVPPTIMMLNQANFATGGSHLQSQVWKEATKILQEWVGQELRPVSLYGIRLYHNGSILAPHVDRMPLVTSAIINVDQDVDEPWPLEVYGHDGKATNITMEPGDMVLYESHSVIHGRPFPLNGKFYANVFVHFEPMGRSSDEDENAQAAGSSTGHTADIPPYILRGGAWERDWIKEHPEGWLGDQLNAREAVWKGQLDVVKRIHRLRPDEMNKADELGWKPFHEAVRSGEIEIVRFLVEQGADVNEVTKPGQSPLNIAMTNLDANHEMIKLLSGMGAKNLFVPPPTTAEEQEL